MYVGSAQFFLTPLLDGASEDINDVLSEVQLYFLHHFLSFEEEIFCFIVGYFEQK